jgi:tetratricopeptide (TPR) repeat protein
MKAYDKAIKFINASIEVQQVTFHKEYTALGDIARERKDLKLALDYYKKAHEENPKNPMTYYQICFIADRYYKDPKTRLLYFETFKTKFSKEKVIINYIDKRISELKAEIHLAAEE